MGVYLCMQNDKNNTIMEHTMELYQSPTSTFDGQHYECVCCGRKLKDNHNQYVHLNTNWVAVHPSIDEFDFIKVTGSESQGWWKIGNECAKKMKNFTFFGEVATVKYND
jgi:hypothetical protein